MLLGFWSASILFAVLAALFPKKKESKLLVPLKSQYLQKFLTRAFQYLKDGLLLTLTTMDLNMNMNMNMSMAMAMASIIMNMKGLINILMITKTAIIIKNQMRFRKNWTEKTLTKLLHQIPFVLPLMLNLAKKMFNWMLFLSFINSFISLGNYSILYLFIWN